MKIESDERRPSRQVAELLARHLEISTDQRGMFLKVARREKSPDALGQASFPDRSSSYPLTPDPLIGREFELTQIMRLVENPQCRLITLAGQGGIGKTHLAAYLAASLAADPGRAQVAFVSLAPVKDREQTVTAIADALRIVLYAASDRAEQLFSYLLDRDLLLILDNFEHLAADARCTNLVSDILRACPRVKIMTTSRHPLQLQAEWVFEVQGLPVSKSRNPDRLKTNSAVMLFVRRANQTRIGFDPSIEELTEIAHICELVEGLPLGIELAAAWVRMLSCREISREIQSSMDFLATSARDLPERQRSIRATIEYSWKLLSKEEQRVLRQLSIFGGGFSRQAAEQVADASLTVLSGLVSKSLVRRAGAARYDLHELIRQYAADGLQEDKQAFAEARNRHSRYFASLLDRRGVALKGADRPTVVAELISDIANLRQAWHWSSTHQQARELSLSADTLFWLYESRSNCREGIPMFEEAVEGLQAGAQGRSHSGLQARQLALGQALGYKGYFLFRQGQHPQARDSLRASLDLLHSLQEDHSDDLRMAISNSTAFLGTVISVMGDFAGGDHLLEEALELKQGLNDPWGSAFCLRQLGLSVYHHQGDYERAHDVLQRSLAISRELGNAWSIAASLSQLGFVAHSQGDYLQAEQHLVDALKLSEALEDRASIAFALDNLGLVKTAQGRYDEALRMLQESIALWKEIGEKGSLAQTLIHYGSALLRIGRPSDAHEYFTEALNVSRAAQITPILLDALIGEAEIRIARGELEYAWAVLQVVGKHPSSSHSTRSRAGQLHAELESRISPAQLAATRSRMQSASLDMMVHKLLSK